MLDKVVSSSFDTINAAPHVRFSLLKNRSTSLRSTLSLRSVLRSSGLSFGGRPGPRSTSWTTSGTRPGASPSNSNRPSGLAVVNRLPDAVRVV